MHMSHRPRSRYRLVMRLCLSCARRRSPWPLVPVAPQAIGIPLHQPSAGVAQAKRTGATVPEHLQEPGGCSTNRCHDARGMWKVTGRGKGSKARAITNPESVPVPSPAISLGSAEPLLRVRVVPLVRAIVLPPGASVPVALLATRRLSISASCLFPMVNRGIAGSDGSRH